MTFLNVSNQEERALAEKDQAQENEAQGGRRKKINDPLTRTDAEAPRAEFEGNKPKKGWKAEALTRHR